MDFLSIREKVSRLIIFLKKSILRIKGNTIALILLPFLVSSIIFGVFFIKQEILLRQKESVLENLYLEKDISERAEIQHENGKIMVFVCGHVKEPGVYGLETGSRVIDAVDAAGGLSEDAFIDSLNLAQVVIDGERIYIPDLETAGETGLYSQGKDSGEMRMNINNASKDQLESLPGIGPVTAQKIIDYRIKNGGFKDIEELKMINGIGDKKYMDLKDLLCI